MINRSNLINNINLMIIIPSILQGLINSLINNKIINKPISMISLISITKINSKIINLDSPLIINNLKINLIFHNPHFNNNNHNPKTNPKNKTNPISLISISIHSRPHPKANKANNKNLHSERQKRTKKDKTRTC